MIKKITLLLLLIAFQGYSQIEAKLIGEWKAIAIDNGAIFYNLKNDSISLNPDSNFPKENLELLRIAMKASISDKKYYFTDTNELRCMIAPGYEIIVLYELVKDEEIINLYEENGNESPVGHIEYRLQDNNLELKMTIEEDDGFLILEKVK